jgi:hypothetical protein
MMTTDPVLEPVGKVRKVAPKPRPSGLLTIARLMAESQKNKQEG